MIYFSKFSGCYKQISRNLAARESRGKKRKKENEELNCNTQVLITIIYNNHDH